MIGVMRTEQKKFTEFHLGNLRKALRLCMSRIVLNVMWAAGGLMLIFERCGGATVGYRDVGGSRERDALN